MDLIVKKYCSRYKIPIDKFYKVCGLGIVSVYGLKVSYPYWSKVFGQTKDRVQVNHFNGSASSLKPIKKKPTVGKQFLKEFHKLLKIIVPGLYTIEAGLVSAHTVTLIARTFLSIYVASLEANVVKYIVQKDIRRFVYMLMKWLLVAVPATFINSSIRFLENKLALKFRSRLTKHSYDLYFKNETYYRVGNLDNRLDNMDQCMTDDLTAFSSLVAHLYSRLTKPLLDIILICVSMYKLIAKMKGSHAAGPLISTATICLTGAILRAVSPKFGELVAVEADKKGQLRAAHSRVVTNAEEISFYGGHKIEMKNLFSCYEELINHKGLIFKKRLWYIMLEQFLMKYIWSAGGMVIIAVPLMTAMNPLISEEDKMDGGISSRTQAFTFAKNLLASGADACERLLSSYKKIIELAGYTSRVSLMLKVLHEVSQGNFVRKTLASDHELQRKIQETLPSDLKMVNGVLHPAGQVHEADNMISLKDVPIITPNYDVIVQSMSMEISKNMHLLITGPNGCGKSSLFRILSGLWPVYKGILYTPLRSKMYYIPQRPYMSIGTLRDQIIYPDSIDEMKEKKIQDSDLDAILDIVCLKHIIQREGGWDSRSYWKDVLSGGEKQRVGIARLFYHKPQFALLDECTSAVSIDVESKIYQTIKDYGICLLTITHRPSLWKFHTHILQFDGEGGWKLENMDSRAMLTLNEEKHRLESQLAGVPEMQARYKQLCVILSQDGSSVIQSSNSDD